MDKSKVKKGEKMGLGLVPNQIYIYMIILFTNIFNLIL